MSRRKRRGRRQRGQAAVETAIVMPLFVFLILGIIQLALMHQARSMVKYAAFKAVRAGILHHADTDGGNTMEMAALAALLPVISQKTDGGGETVRSTRNADDYITKMGMPHFQNNRFPENGGLKYVEVEICAPTSGAANRGKVIEGNLSFDSPMDPNVDWAGFEASKLVVQVTLNYRLFIPFADMVIYLISRGQEREHPVLFQQVTRLDKADLPPSAAAGPRRDASETIRQDLARNNRIYVVPIRASYALRMQSDILVNHLPSTNNCVFPSAASQ